MEARNCPLRPTERLQQLTSGACARIVFGSLVKAAVAAVDLLGTALIVRQVPAEALVRNPGWRTYWRSPKEAVLSPPGPTIATGSLSIPRP